MSQPTTASLQALFKFPFQGEQWKNRFLVGSGLMLAGMFIPILPVVFVYGYVVAAMRRIIEGEAPALPAWDDWGRLGTDGLRAMLVSFLYLLPGTIVYCGGMALYFAGCVFFPLLMGSGSQDGGVAVLATFLMLGNMGVFMVSLCLGTLLWLLGVIPLPLATAHFVAKDKVGAAFRVGQWWRILRANKMAFLVDWVIVAGLVAIVYLGYMLLYYSVALCCLLPFLAAPAGFYLLLVCGAKFAQSYREGAEAPAAAEAEAA